MSIGKTTEVLVGTAPTALPGASLYLRKGFALQNLGPNPIFLAFDAADCVLDKAWKVNTGDTWTAERSGMTVYAVCSVAQATGAATIVMELQ